MQIRQEAKQAVKYGAVGVLNTVITAVVYYLLRKIDFSVDGANLISYEAGFLNSYIWNRLWVFQSHQNDWRKEGLIFWMGAHICWALQWLAFRLFLQFLAEAWAYGLGMCIYPVLNYLFNRFVTFQKNKNA